jgi:hypothetical protein
MKSPSPNGEGESSRLATTMIAPVADLDAFVDAKRLRPVPLDRLQVAPLLFLDFAIILSISESMLSVEGK